MNYEVLYIFEIEKRFSGRARGRVSIAPRLIKPRICKFLVSADDFILRTITTITIFDYELIRNYEKGQIFVIETVGRYLNKKFYFS